LKFARFFVDLLAGESEKEYDDSRDPSYLIGFCGKDEAKTVGYLSVE
jgi:hypothetical protein